MKVCYRVKLSQNVLTFPKCPHSHGRLKLVHKLLAESVHTQQFRAVIPTNRTTICAVQPASLCVLCLGKPHRLLSKYAGQALSGPTSDNTHSTDYITCTPNCWCTVHMCMYMYCIYVFVHVSRHTREQKKKDETQTSV